MTRSACGMVGVLLAETSPSSRAARRRSSLLDLDFPGAAAELRLSNIAVGNISIPRSVSSASSRSWAASRPSRAQRPGMEAGALGLDWTAPRRARRTARCSRRRSSSRTSIVYDTSLGVSRAPPSHTYVHYAHRLARTRHTGARARWPVSTRRRRARGNGTAHLTSSIERVRCVWVAAPQLRRAVNQRRVVGW